MFIRISKTLTQTLVELNTIKEEEREIYRYGIQQGLIIILNLITIMAIGALFRMLWQAIVFIIAFIPLRIYAGGYHAKTYIHCYVFSIILMSTMLLVMRCSELSNLTCGLLSVISSLFIIILSPVEDSNKPLDARERQVYRKRIYWITILELFCAVLSWLLHCYSLLKCMSFTLVVMCFILILGLIKNKYIIV